MMQSRLQSKRTLILQANAVAAVSKAMKSDNLQQALAAVDMELQYPSQPLKEVPLAVTTAPAEAAIKAKKAAGTVAAERCIPAPECHVAFAWHLPLPYLSPPYLQFSFRDNPKGSNRPPVSYGVVSVAVCIVSVCTMKASENS